MPAQPPGHNAPEAPLRRIAADTAEVVLTFDDGPNRHTAQFAEVLRQENVPAAFFWLGNDDLEGLDDAATLIQDGHQLGSHGVTHRRPIQLADAELQWEIAEASRVLAARSGVPIRHFRPPFGAVDERTLSCAHACGMAVVLWDIDTRDWALAHAPERIVENALKARPGSIILMHQRPQTLTILAELIRALRAAGYGFRLLPDPPRTREAEGEAEDP